MQHDAIDVLHDQEDAAIGVDDILAAHDIRVIIDVDKLARLGLEPLERRIIGDLVDAAGEGDGLVLAIGEPVREELLDRDRPFDHARRARRSIGDTEAALAEHLPDDVAADLGSDRQGISG